MAKKLLSIVLAITMAVCLLPTNTFAHVYYGGTISSDVEEREDTILLNADTTIAEGVTFALTLSAYQHIELHGYTLTNYGTITTAYSTNEFDGGTFYNYGVCEITGFYKVTVYDLTLSSIALSSGSISGFSAGTRAYSVTVDNSVTSIDITPTLNTGTGVKSMTVNGVTATSGVASTVSLNVGENTIPIVITADDGSDTANTYTLTVTRASAVDYTISNALFVSAGTLGISQDMLQWSNVDAPGGYKLEIYTESGTQVYSGTLTNNYTPASEVLTTSGSYYFIVYALDTSKNVLSGKQSSTFTFTHTHSLTHVEAQAETCTDDGNSEYWYCSSCGKYFSDSAATAEISQSSTVLSAKGHSLTHVEAQGATCTADGNSEYWYCTECGKYFSDSAATAEISLSDTVLSAKGHSLTHVEAQGATCTADGNSEYWYCTECGKYFSDSAATAEISQSDTVLSATGHSMTHYEAVDVSCTTDGNIEYWYCANCDKYFSDEDGNSEITDTSTITIAATGHNYVDTVTDPTCTEQGYTTHTCDNCGESYVDTYVEATGHSYGTPVWTWESDYSTCTATFTCDKGDDTQILTATVTSATTDATCTTDGEIAYTSTVTFNGNEYTDTQTEAIAATGHTYGEPVFTWNGNTCTATFTCTECDDTQTVDATVTSKNFFGMVTRTAEVTFEGLTYTDTKTTGRSLLTIMADYTSVNNAIAKANALNASDYSNFADVTAAINAVQWNLNVLNQSTVNGYAEAIETAIANLKAAELTEETVTINEPIEDTNTETEPDDIEVDDTDEETNPTTGIALAMLPMAIALAATVANKRG